MLTVHPSHLPNILKGNQEKPKVVLHPKMVHLQFQPLNGVTSENEKTAFYKCSECILAFSEITKLNEHFDSAHSSNQKPGVDETNDVIFKCAECFQTFHHESELATHFSAKHSSEVPETVQNEPVICFSAKPPSEVPKSIKKELTKHFKIKHSSEVGSDAFFNSQNKLLSCEKCPDLPFEKKDDLLQHMLTYHIKAIQGSPQIANGIFFLKLIIY